MPPLVRLYARSACFGIVLGAIFTGLLFGLDVAHLRHLVVGSDVGWIAVALMVGFHTLLFGGVQFAIAVMAMADTSDPGRGKLCRAHPRPTAVSRMRPVPLPAHPPRR